MPITVSARELESPPLDLAAAMRERACAALEAATARQIEAMLNAPDLYAAAVEARRARFREFADGIEARIARGEMFTAERLRAMFDKFQRENPEPTNPCPW